MINYLKEKVRKVYNQDLDFYDLPHEMFNDVINWPMIPEIEPFQDSLEPLDLENFEWLEINEKELKICAGGDWQEPMNVTMKIEGDKLKVIDFKNAPYKEGMDEDMFNDLLGVFNGSPM